MKLQTVTFGMGKPVVTLGFPFDSNRRLEDLNTHQVSLSNPLVRKLDNTGRLHDGYISYDDFVVYPDLHPEKNEGSVCVLIQVRGRGYEIIPCNEKHRPITGSNDEQGHSKSFIFTIKKEGAIRVVRGGLRYFLTVSDDGQLEVLDCKNAISSRPSPWWTCLKFWK